MTASPGRPPLNVGIERFQAESGGLMMLSIIQPVDLPFVVADAAAADRIGRASQQRRRSGCGEFGPISGKSRSRTRPVVTHDLRSSTAHPRCCVG